MNNRNILSLLAAFISVIVAQGQTQVPNGEFENFDTITNGGGFSWDFPQEWTESLIPNVFSRFAQGEGFFYKYDSTDANGNALLLHRGTPDSPSKSNVPINSGFVRFSSDSIPRDMHVKLVGRYKFSGSDQVDVVDTFRMVAYYSHPSDTLTLWDLHVREIPDRAEVINIIEPTSRWKSFEVDLSKFAGRQTEYMTIQFIMSSGISNPLKYHGFSKAVVDDLRIIQSPKIGLKEAPIDNEELKIYPNPIEDYLIVGIAKPHSNIMISLRDNLGRVVFEERYPKSSQIKIDMKRELAGMYFLSIDLDGERITRKVIKR